MRLGPVLAGYRHANRMGATPRPLPIQCHERGGEGAVGAFTIALIIALSVNIQTLGREMKIHIEPGKYVPIIHFIWPSPGGRDD